MKTKFRFQQIFLFALVGIFSCTNDVDQESLATEQEQNNVSQEEVVNSHMGATTGDQIPNIVQELERLTGKSANGTSKGMSLNDVVIDFSNIRWIISQNTGRTNYTFPILVKGQGLDVFYNLIVMVDPDGTILSPIVREYRVAPHAMDDFKASGFDFAKFSGTRKDYHFEDFFNASFDLDLLASRSSDCPTTTIGSASDNPQLNPDLIVVDQHQNWSSGGGGYPIGQVSYDAESGGGAVHNALVYVNLENETQYLETVTSLTTGVVNVGDPNIIAPVLNTGINSTQQQSTSGPFPTGFSLSVNATDDKKCVTSIELTIRYSNGYEATYTIYSGICSTYLTPDMKGASTAAGSTSDCPDGGDSSIVLVPLELVVIQDKLCLPEGPGTAYDFLLNNGPERNALSNFLIDNNVPDGCTGNSPAYYFAKEAAVAMAQGAEVDFENEIIKDSSFIGTKADCILKGLMGQTSYFKNVMDAFTNNNSEYKLKFTTGAVRDGADAQTSPPDENGIITITFRPSSANGKALEVAGILLHESVHAQLFRVLASGNNSQYNITNTDYLWLLQLNEWWKGESSMPEETAQHDFMSVRYVNPIATAVRNYDDNTHPIENYKYFGWEGLFDEGSNRGLISLAQFNELTMLAQIPLNDNHKSPCE